jgi:hypothetical protein
MVVVKLYMYFQPLIRLIHYKKTLQFQGSERDRYQNNIQHIIDLMHDLQLYISEMMLVQTEY